MAKKQLGQEPEILNFQDKLKTWENISKDENSTHEDVVNSAKQMFEALQQDVANKVRKEYQESQTDTAILTSRGQNVLTSEEKKFFNAVLDGLFNEEAVLPVTTVNRIFDELVIARPLLTALGIQNLGAVTRFIYADPTKAYGWKEIFGEITGQSNAIFRDETFTQLKLTSYVVVPNDMLELGPEWIERYVRTLLVEVMGEGLEYGFVNGRGVGQLEPTGLIKDVDPISGAVTDKVSSGTLTFQPSAYGEIVAGELFNVVSALSVDAAGKKVDVSGKVVMVVNPTDAIAVAFRNTIQTHNGTWVTALPYNIQVVESTQVADKKAIFFVKGRYLGATAGGTRLKKFDQTLAMEDATLYTIKQFANGKAKDNKAALVYDLDIEFTPAPTPAP